MVEIRNGIIFDFYTGLAHMKFLTSDIHSTEAVILKLHMKLAPVWALIQVNFDPLLKIGHKVDGGCALSQDYS